MCDLERKEREREREEISAVVWTTEIAYQMKDIFNRGRFDRQCPRLLHFISLVPIHLSHLFEYESFFGKEELIYISLNNLGAYFSSLWLRIRVIRNLPIDHSLVKLDIS